MKKIVVIVAGGSGKRMNTETLKQFMILRERPILFHSIERFYNYDPEIEIRLVLPYDEIVNWQLLCKKYRFNRKHLVYPGGKFRFNSVKNGLKDIDHPSLVGIHDGVRPLVNIRTISNCFDLAEKFGAAVPVLQPVESIRRITSDGSVAEDRKLYRSVQTPQVFQSEILIKAYNTNYRELFTDDASVVENDGNKIYLAEGNEENIKITSPKDLKIAEVLFDFLNDHE